MDYLDSNITTASYLKQALMEVKKNYYKLTRHIKVGLGKYSQNSSVMARKLKMFLLALIVTMAVILARLHIPIIFDNVFLWGGIYFLIGVLAFLLSIRILRPVNKYTMFSVVIFPAIFAFVGAFAIHTIFLFELARISYVLVFSLLIVWYLLSLWVFILMTNIMNVNMQSFVPISKLAEGVLRLYIITVHVLIGFIDYILLTGQYLLFGLNSVWIAIGIILLILLWLGIYRYFSRDFSKTGLVFAIGIVLLLHLITLILFAIVPNAIVILLLLLFIIWRFFEYFVVDINTVE